MRLMQVEIDEDFLEQFTDFAKQQLGMTRSAAVRLAMKDWLDREVDKLHPSDRVFKAFDSYLRATR